MLQANRTNDLFRQMAKKVQNRFAERDPVTGELDEAAVVIKWPDGREWKGRAIVGKEELSIELSSDLESVYTRNVDIELSQFGSTDIPRSASVATRGHKYVLASQGSSVDASNTYMRLALVRRPLVQQKSMHKRG